MVIAKLVGISEVTMKKDYSVVKFWLVQLAPGMSTRFADYIDAWKFAEGYYASTGKVATVEPCYQGGYPNRTVRSTPFRSGPKHAILSL